MRKDCYFIAEAYSRTLFLQSDFSSRPFNFYLKVSVRPFTVTPFHITQVICLFSYKYKYTQLSRKRPVLVHDKVVAYGRWSSTGKIKKKNLKLNR